MCKTVSYKEDPFLGESRENRGVARKNRGVARKNRGVEEESRSCGRIEELRKNRGKGGLLEELEEKIVVGMGEWAD